MPYVIIPPCCEKLYFDFFYLYKYSVKSTDFALKWFLLIPAKFYQKFLLKYKILLSQAHRTMFFYSSPALNLHLKVFTKLHNSHCKTTKFSSFKGAHLPADTPRAHKCTIGDDAPPNHQKNVEDGSTPLVRGTQSYRWDTPPSHMHGQCVPYTILQQARNR